MRKQWSISESKIQDYFPIINFYFHQRTKISIQPCWFSMKYWYLFIRWLVEYFKFSIFHSSKKLRVKRWKKCWLEPTIYIVNLNKVWSDFVSAWTNEKFGQTYFPRQVQCEATNPNQFTKLQNIDNSHEYLILIFAR